MMYMDFDTGEKFTLNELKAEYKMFAHEMEYEDFEDFFEDVMSIGRQKIGGIVEVEQ